MKKPEYKLTSIEHITQLMQQIQHTLDYRDHKTLDCLSTILDDHFVELAKTDEYTDLIEHLSAFLDSKCTLIQEIENTKCLLEPMIGLLSNMSTKNPSQPNDTKSDSPKRVVRGKVYHKVDFIEF